MRASCWLGLLYLCLLMPAHAELVPLGQELVINSQPRNTAFSNAPASVAIDSNPLTGEYVACAVIEPVDRIECTHRNIDDVELRKVGFNVTDFDPQLELSHDVLEVKLDDLGRFYILWIGFDNNADAFKSYVMGIDTVAAADPFLFNTPVAGIRTDPINATLALTPGHFWIVADSSFSASALLAEIYRRDGSFLTVRQLSPDITEARDCQPSAVSNRSGDVAVAWVYREATAGSICRGDIYVQTFRETGQSLSDPMLISEPPDNNAAPQYRRPQASADANGEYIIAWQDQILGTPSTRSLAARTSLSGQLVLSPEDLFTFTGRPRVDGLANGADYLAVGESQGIDCSLIGRLALEGELDPEVSFVAISCGLAWDIALLANGDLGIARLYEVSGGLAELRLARYLPPAIMEVAGVSVDEGDPQRGQGPVASSAVSLLRPHPTGETIEISYFTRDDTALAGFDYVQTQGALQFDTPTVLTQSIDIPIIPDTQLEPDERFSINIENPVNAVIRRNSESATITIRNDDQTPAVTLNCLPAPGVCRTEPEPLPGQTQTVDLLVQMAATVGSDVQLNYQTIDQTATAGVDYVAASGTVTIPAGSTQASISLALLGDDQIEATESFLLRLSASPSVSLSAIDFVIEISDDVLCFLELDPAGHDVPIAGGQRSFNITTAAGCSWTAQSLVPWATVTAGSSGTGPGNVTYAVDARSDQQVPARFGEILVTTGPPASSISHVIEQEGDPNFCQFTVNPAMLSFDVSGGMADVDVATIVECGWEVFSDDSWVSVTAPTAPVMGDGTLSLSVAANTAGPNVETATRNSTLDAPFMLTIEQTGCQYDLAQATLTAPALGVDTLTAEILAPGVEPSPCEWTAVSNAPWILVTGGTAGSGGGQVTLDVLENPSVVARSGSVQIGDEVLVVEQEGQPCSYQLLPDTLSLCAETSVESLVVAASAGCSWQLSSADDWLQITSNASGIGDEIASLNAVVNLSEVSRQGAVNLQSMAGGSALDTLTVQQDGFLVYEDFAAGLPIDWQFTPASAWSADTGELLGSLLDGGVGTAVDRSLTGYCRECEVESDVTLTSLRDGPGDALTLVGWYQGPDHWVGLAMDEFANRWRLQQRAAGVVTSSEIEVAEILPNQTYRLGLSFDGQRFYGSVDGEVVLSLDRQSGTEPEGFAGVMLDDANGRFDDLRVLGRSAPFESIFADSFEQLMPMLAQVCGSP